MAQLRQFATKQLVKYCRLRAPATKIQVPGDKTLGASESRANPRDVRDEVGGLRRSEVFRGLRLNRVGERMKIGARRRRVSKDNRRDSSLELGDEAVIDAVHQMNVSGPPAIEIDA